MSGYTEDEDWSNWPEYTEDKKMLSEETKTVIAAFLAVFGFLGLLIIVMSL